MKYLKVTIENHRASATIAQLQQRLVTQQAQIDSWKATAENLSQQVKELRKSKQEKRTRTKTTAIQAEDKTVSV